MRIRTGTVVAVVAGAIVGLLSWMGSSSVVIGIGTFAFGTSVLVYFENEVSDRIAEVRDRLR